MSKALALVSGGLDSLLAARVIMEQGIEVMGVCFVMSFASRDIEGFKQNVHKNACSAKIPLKIFDISEEFLRILENPRHGYGANLNPCIDCKILMLTHAKAMMAALKADFIVTGEVLGERPMSQRRDALNTITKGADLAGYLLRPLSAKVLDPTIPEQEGMVDRSRLHNITGRGRSRQFELAEKYGITKYFTPAGGCLLTDPGFTRRMKDLMRHGGLDPDAVKLLKHGRHFRIDAGTRVVVGRDEADNENILSTGKEMDVIVRLKEIAGPYVLLRGNTSISNIKKAASLCVSHSKSKNMASEKCEYWTAEGNERDLEAAPMIRTEIEKYRI
ncbi:MAG: tRNA 4-thiouridine(8) synthase ThiI [Candidatus Omnitrophica bacterium]|nr:tRNA 4-thiouridine(8) synthase ThiI [Candidatus Omnitrophota bacterium]